ncbi:MAG: L,D-transpeptidase family protein [Firmicutes bacterium]|nr:L,D-transpeptidase family protein [Bacillota bacterium]
MRKALIFIAVLICICAGALGAMTSKYLSTADYTDRHFPAGYIINGVRVYDMDYDDAIDTITEAWNAGDILVTGTMDEPLGTIRNVKCTYNIGDQVRNVKKNHKVLSAMNHYLNVPVSVRIPMKVDKVGRKFKKSVLESNYLQRGTVTETTDAYVDLNDPDFRIVEEVYGSKPDTEKFFQDILTCIELGETVFQYDESNYTAIPEVKSDDPQLLAYQTFCRTYLNQKIVYDLGEDSMTITRQDLEALMQDNLSGEADPEAVAKFVAGIADKYDNVGRKRSFTSLTGKTFDIDNGTYGWSVDQEGEAAQLIEDINSHKDVSRQPVWATTGYGEYSLNIGNTYIDIDVTKQKLIFFKDGRKAFSSDVVTGCRNYGTTTPTGLYSVLNKARDINLKGRNIDGSKYSSFVHYWMAFLGGSYGMHDASWRTEFGGDIWITNGSHGCVNMPPSTIPKLYEMVDYGTPVIVHY